MSESIDVDLNALAQSLENKSNTKDQGQSTLVQNGQLTPGTTPGPDTARIEADRRRQELQKQKTSDQAGGGSRRSRSKSPDRSDRSRSKSPNRGEVDPKDKGGQVSSETTPGTHIARDEVAKSKQEAGQKRKTPSGSSEEETNKKRQGDGGDFAASRPLDNLWDDDEDNEFFEQQKRRERKKEEFAARRKNATEMVLKAPDNPNAILLVKEGDDKPKIESNYTLLTNLIDPDKNEHPRAREAFEKVERAMKYLRGESPGESNNFTEKQQEVVQRILNAPVSAYEILGLKGPEDGNKVEAAAKNLLSETNPESNKHPNAMNAFKRVIWAKEELKKKNSEMFVDENGMEIDVEKEEPDDFDKPTTIEYPWTTGHTKDGEPIIAHQFRTRRGHQEGVRCVVETGYERLEWKNESEVGYEELKHYLKLDGIKEIGQKDENSNKIKKWSWKDREDFKEFLWAIVGTINTSTEGGGRRDPETLCCARFGNIDLLMRSEFSNAVGKKVSNGCIETYCKKADITPPWKVQSEMVRMPRKNFEKMKGTNSAVHAGEKAYSSEQSSGNESKLTERLVAMEGKIADFQASKSGEGSLQDILAKLEKRMASVEQKLLKVDEIEKSTLSLAQVVSALCDKAGIGK
ncbi:MAG: hypothetical protein M1813_009686 [Trichoglossum hirsutum]|nr:MAG: hypothetical protein M1813_009686 [Trichoglossum hirsutum]